ncbi:Gfo/Idh/MocA family oxidoreductase [Nocardiopsis tropica]|uniref:Gfo/Idh/MocA family protein n=1 Tax=Tsukamurella strandjordii TaxID=147577 RepID=UPI0031D2611D
MTTGTTKEKTMVESAENPMRIVVVSAAHVHAASYLELLARRPDVIVALSDDDGVTSNEEGPRGADLAAQYGIDYLAGDALYRWQPDAVVICAENDRHRRLTEEAAAHGVHVLCEKPLATSAEDANAMVAAADAAGVRLMTAYPVRFAPEFAELCDAVERGALGRVISIRGTNNGKIPQGRNWFVDRAKAGGGALTDHVVHCADLIDALLGEIPSQVYAVANSVIPSAGDVETAGLVSLVYPSGVIGTIDCSWSRPAASARWGDLTLTVEGTEATMSIAPFGAGLSGDTVDGAAWVPFGADLDSRMLEEFLASVREGRAPWPDGRAGARTAAIVDAAHSSAREGIAVSPKGSPIPAGS